MEHSEPKQVELEYVEEVANVFERMGAYRMLGRVMGWLLICDPPEQSFGQITDALQASKGSISAAMRYLVASGLVRKKTRPGDRRSYFFVEPDALPRIAAAQAERYGEMTRIAGVGLEMLSDQPDARTERLRTLHEFFGWLEDEMPKLWRRWEQQNRQEGRTP